MILHVLNRIQHSQQQKNLKTVSQFALLSSLKKPFWWAITLKCIVSLLLLHFLYKFHEQPLWFLVKQMMHLNPPPLNRKLLKKKVSHLLFNFKETHTVWLSDSLLTSVWWINATSYCIALKHRSTFVTECFKAAACTYFLTQSAELVSSKQSPPV